MIHLHTINTSLTDVHIHFVWLVLVCSIPFISHYELKIEKKISKPKKSRFWLVFLTAKQNSKNYPDYF